MCPKLGQTRSDGSAPRIREPPAVQLAVTDLPMSVMFTGFCWLCPLYSVAKLPGSSSGRLRRRPLACTKANTNAIRVRYFNRHKSDVTAIHLLADIIMSLRSKGERALETDFPPFNDEMQRSRRYLASLSSTRIYESSAGCRLMIVCMECQNFDLTHPVS